MIFDSVFSPSLEHLRDFCPFVSVLFLQNIEDKVFFGTPLGLFDFWVEVVVPSLSALLANFAWQMLGNLAPVAGTFLLNQLYQESILVFVPRGIVFD